MSDESAVREALHDLTGGQPAAPVDRVVGVRRRHVRRRSAQLSAGVVALAVIVAGLLILPSTLDRNSEPAGRSVPSWALPWPDHRDGSVSQHDLDGAVTAWRHFHADKQIDVLPKPTSVTWYVGQRAVNDSEIVVVFEVDGAEGHRLVAGFEGAAPVDHVAPGTTPWVLYDVPAPPPSYHGIVGINLTQSGPVDQNTFRNWIVVLTRPSIQSIGWSSAGLAGDSAASSRGLLITDSGRPRGQVYAIISERADETGALAQPLPVMVPGAPKSAPPVLQRPAPLHGVPNDRASMGEAAGQGTATYGDESFRGSGPTTIYARCYGAASMRVAVDVIDQSAGATVPCDGRQHTVAGGRLHTHSPLAGHGHLFTVNATAFTAWRVEVVAG
jgi:hypothetical protein